MALNLFKKGDKPKKADKPQKQKKGFSLPNLGIGKKKSKQNKDNYIQQLHLQPVYEEAFIDSLNKKIKDPNEPYIAVDRSREYSPDHDLVYMLGLTNDLIKDTPLSKNLSDLKTAIKLSESDSGEEERGSIFNASFATDLDPEEDPDNPDIDYHQLVFLPTLNTIDMLNTLAGNDQQYEIVSIPADISADNLDDFYEQGIINMPLMGDDEPLTMDLASFEDFVQERTKSPEEDGGLMDDPASDVGENDDQQPSDDIGMDDDPSQDPSMDDTGAEDNENVPGLDDDDEDNDFGIGFADDNEDDGNTSDDSSSNDMSGISMDDGGDTDDIGGIKMDDDTSSADNIEMNDNTGSDDTSSNDSSSSDTISLDDDKDNGSINELTIDDTSSQDDTSNDNSDDSDSAKDDGNGNDDEALAGLNATPDDAFDDFKLENDSSSDDQSTESGQADDQSTESVQTTEPTQPTEATQPTETTEPEAQPTESQTTDSDQSNDFDSVLNATPDNQDENQDEEITDLNNMDLANDNQDQSSNENNLIDDLSNDNLNDYQTTTPEDTQYQEQPQTSNYDQPTQPSQPEKMAISELGNQVTPFDNLLSNVIPVNEKEYLSKLQLMAGDESEEFVYKDPEAHLIYLLGLTSQDADEAHLTDKDVGVLRYALDNGDKYGTIQGSITQGSLKDDLENHTVIFVPNEFTLDSLESLFGDKKLTVYSIPDDISADNLANYQSLHQVDIPVSAGVAHLRLNVEDFKERIRRLRKSQKLLSRDHENSSDKVVINIDNPTNLDQLNAENLNTSIGAENEAAVKKILDLYTPKIDRLLNSIKTPVFGIDPIKDSDPEVITAKQMYNSTLKSDVAQVKSSIKAKIIDQITESLRDFTDPNKFPEAYPKADAALREKFVNEDSINRSIAERTRRIQGKYMTRRHNMIAESVQKAKDDFQHNEVPKRDHEIAVAEKTIRQKHSEAYLAAVNRALAQQRTAQKGTISESIDKILDDAQTSVDEGKEKIMGNTKTYMGELIRTTKDIERTKRLIAISQGITNNNPQPAPIPQTPSYSAPQAPVQNVENDNKYKQLQQQFTGEKMAHEETIAKKDSLIQQLQDQLQASQEQAKQAQLAAAQAKESQAIAEHERDQYRDTNQKLQAQVLNNGEDVVDALSEQLNSNQEYTAVNNVPKPHPTQPAHPQTPSKSAASIDDIFTNN